MDRKEKVLRQLEEAVERAHFWEEHNKEIFVKGYPNFTVFLDDKKSKISPVIDIETFIEK
ncbi:hypothetical protein HYX19_02115 [Candidatus Woesearchaeota archaeon]|nr:hypothetical protein [Candidatus Woesearchaeota archaeon]